MKLKYSTLLFILFIGIGLYAQDITNKKHLEEISINEDARYKRLIQNRNKVVNLRSKSLNKIDGVYLGIENGLPLHMMANDFGQIISTNVYQLHHKNNPLNIKATGQNIPIFMWDEGGVMTTHQEFSNRVTNRESASLSYHSTAVAGIMVGNGTYPDAIGMAWESTVQAYDFENNTSEIAKEARKNPNLLLSNHSYGYLAGWNQIYGDKGYGWYWYGYPSVNEEESSLYGYYSDLDKMMDDITYNSPNNTIVKAAGNDRGIKPDEQTPHWALNENKEWQESNTTRPANCGKTGYDCIPHEGVSKNILLVGSTLKLPYRYESPDNVVASNFSSFGPTDDGRIKPDIVAPGSDITTPNNQDYNSYSKGGNGTSLSAPAVTGIIALLQEINYKKEKRYLRSDEVKALVTSTANEAGEHPGPDYSFGWGIIDALQAVEAIVTSSVSKRTLNNNGTDELEIKAKGNTPLKVSIAWLDPPAKVVAQPNDPLSFNNRTPTLVNDLDLRIFDSSGKEYFPWALNVENPSAAAVQKDNIVDNIEQVLIDSPIAGETYTIKISHKGTLKDNLGNNAPSQVYALVVLESRQTSILESGEKLLIYPVPSSDYINFRLASPLTDVNMKVFDINGSLLLQKKYDELISGEKLNVSYFSPGHYLLILESNEKNYVKKFIKK